MICLATGFPAQGKGGNLGHFNEITCLDQLIQFLDAADLRAWLGYCRLMGEKREVCGIEDASVVHAVIGE